MLSDGEAASAEAVVSGDATAACDDELVDGFEAVVSLSAAVGGALLGSEDEASELEDVDGEGSSARAVGELVTKAPPMPSATASAPTRPTYLVYVADTVGAESDEFIRLFAKPADVGWNSNPIRVGRGNDTSSDESICCRKCLPLLHPLRDFVDNVTTPRQQCDPH